LTDRKLESQEAGRLGGWEAGKQRAEPEVGSGNAEGGKERRWEVGKVRR